MKEKLPPINPKISRDCPRTKDICSKGKIGMVTFGFAAWTFLGEATGNVFIEIWNKRDCERIIGKIRWKGNSGRAGGGIG